MSWGDSLSGRFRYSSMKEAAPAESMHFEWDGTDAADQRAGIDEQAQRGCRLDGVAEMGRKASGSCLGWCRQRSFG